MSFLKNIWRNSSKHKKLSEERALAKNNKDIEADFCESSEDLTENNETESVFILKYIGSTLVENATNEHTTSEAIKTILRVAKAAGKKIPKVSVKISPTGIQISDELTDKNNDISIFRISYCSADAAHSRVFAFIAANSNETMECHAFLCDKRKQAQTVTLAVARSFSMAYEQWRITPASPTKKQPENCVKINQLIDLGDLGDLGGFGDFEAQTQQHKPPQWVSFDEDLIY